MSEHAPRPADDAGGCHAPGGTTITADLPRIALIGSPNAGKTSIFNHLTGLRARTGNYPGVTVTRTQGIARIDSVRKVIIEDLPGTYSLDPISPDEQVVADLLAGRLDDIDPPDALLLVIDATVLERSLALVTQALSLRLPTAAIVTMTDEMAVRGGHIDLDALSRAFGIPVAGVVGSRGRGFDEVRRLLSDPAAWQRPAVPPPLGGAGDDSSDDTHDDVADTEYESWARSVLTTAEYTAPTGHGPTARVDRILLHPVWGVLTFFLVMFLFFQVIFTVAAPLQDLVESGFTGLGEWSAETITQPVVADFVSTAVLGGLGGVLVFVPQIMLLFLLISLLENVGYMSRAAFLMDRVLARAGLEGRAFVAMLSSFACAVPGIMATRTIPSSRSRIATILAAPLMTCSARLPVFVLLTGMLVGTDAKAGPFSAQGVAMFGLYVLGGTSSLIAATVLKRTVLRGDPLPFYMEMPPYRLPSAKAVLLSMWDSSWVFLRKVGTIIFAVTVVLWVMLSLPIDSTAEGATRDAAVAAAAAEGESEEDAAATGAAAATQYRLQHSVAGRIGRAVEPIFAPLGFDWRVDISLLASFAAREVFVSSLGQISAASDPEDPQGALETMTYTSGANEGEKVFTPPTIAAMLIFFVFSLQCMSTIAAMRRETNSWKWPGLAFAYMFVLAYVGALIAHTVTGWIVG